LEETIQRISQLVGDFPQIAELDINPFFVFEPGRRPMAIDARVILSSEAVGGVEGPASESASSA
jgi:hypothetical protein